MGFHIRNCWYQQCSVRKLNAIETILSVDFIQPLQAGALGNTVKESQIKIIKLQHLVEALRYIYRFDHIDLICGGVMKVMLPFKHVHIMKLFSFGLYLLDILILSVTM